MANPPRDKDVQEYPTTAAIDTCAVWNILSSRTLTIAAKGKCHFVLADYVRYECLVKRWEAPESADLRAKLTEELRSGTHFSAHSLTVDDLRDLVRSVGKVRRFHQGELAALALARKLYSGFVTDDRTARTVGTNEIGLDRVRTTSHLVGWLVYNGHLTDSDIPIIIKDNGNLNRRYGQLGEFIQACYEHAMGLRLRECTGTGGIRRIMEE